jgi:periplasmic divalent cation tolerance protein
VSKAVPSAVEQAAQPADGAALIWCPFPDETSVEDASAILLHENLVACANILPGMRSLFVGEGKRQESREVGVLFKTRAALVERALARLCALHPYEAPAAVAWRCDAAAPATIAWLGALQGVPA